MSRPEELPPKVVANRRERRKKRYRPGMVPAVPWSTVPNALIYPGGVPEKPVK